MNSMLTFETRLIVLRSLYVQQDRSSTSSPKRDSVGIYIGHFIRNVCLIGFLQEHLISPSYRSNTGHWTLTSRSSWPAEWTVKTGDLRNTECGKAVVARHQTLKQRTWRVVTTVSWEGGNRWQFARSPELEHRKLVKCGLSAVENYSCFEDKMGPTQWQGSAQDKVALRWGVVRGRGAIKIHLRI